MFLVGRKYLLFRDETSWEPIGNLSCSTILKEFECYESIKCSKINRECAVIDVVVKRQNSITHYSKSNLHRKSVTFK